MPLPGLMMPPGLIASSGTPLTIAYRNHTSGQRDAPFAPADTQPNDLLVLIRRHATSHTNPAGFTLFHRRGASGNPNFGVHYKVATGLEAGAQIDAAINTNSSAWTCIAFSGPFSEGLLVSSSVVSGSNSDPDPITIPSGSYNAPCLALGAITAGTTAPLTYTVSPGAFTGTFLFNPEFGRINRVGWVIFNDSEPVNVTIDMNDTGSDNVMIGGCFSAGS